MSSDPSAFVADTEAWRRRRLAKLTAADGWLSVVGLHWLEEGENRIGSDPSSAIRLPAARNPPTLSSVEVSRNRAVLHSDSGSIPLTPDLDREEPFLRHGKLSLSLIARGGRLGVRIRDGDSAARREFTGIRSFPIDPAWRLEARFESYAPARTVPVPNVLGSVDAETSPGAVLFEAAGGVHRLDAILERGEPDYWVIFGDATNGSETYGGGRFVYVRPPVDGRTVIDFNRAYNPPCVFTPYSTCPMPPPRNRMTLRVEAGEMAWSPSPKGFQELAEHAGRRAPDDV